MPSEKDQRSNEAEPTLYLPEAHELIEEHEIECTVGAVRALQAAYRMGASHRRESPVPPHMLVHSETEDLRGELRRRGVPPDVNEAEVYALRKVAEAARELLEWPWQNPKVLDWPEVAIDLRNLHNALDDASATSNTPPGSSGAGACGPSVGEQPCEGEVAGSNPAPAAPSLSADWRAVQDELAAITFRQRAKIKALEKVEKAARELLEYIDAAKVEDDLTPSHWRYVATLRGYVTQAASDCASKTSGDDVTAADGDHAARVSPPLADREPGESAPERVPVCTTCNDTHWMGRGEDRDPVMCTHCPTPCEECRSRGPGRAGGPYCASTPCGCACHSDSAQYREVHRQYLKQPATPPASSPTANPDTLDRQRARRIIAAARAAHDALDFGFGLEAKIMAALAEEREACANAVESMTAHTPGERAMRYDAAAHIRARSTQALHQEKKR